MGARENSPASKVGHGWTGTTRFSLHNIAIRQPGPQWLSCTNVAGRIKALLDQGDFPGNPMRPLLDPHEVNATRHARVSVAPPVPDD